MSLPATGRQRITVPHILEKKAKGEKIVALTAYDATFARLEDKAGVDLILVGDSANMVIAGEPDTISITLDEMVYLTRYVRRGVKHALLAADMPFGSYQISTEQTVTSAIRFLKESGAEAVKIEGGEPHFEAIHRLTMQGVPVIGHLGLTPQSVNQFGGYDLRGVEEAEAERIRMDARRLQEAGCFAIVLEKIPRKLAGEISTTLRIPTIGIGSGPDCDGQILVSYDMLGLGPKFRFVRRYMNGSEEVTNAVKQYSEDVKSGHFPSDEESYSS